MDKEQENKDIVKFLSREVETKELYRKEEGEELQGSEEENE